MDDDVVVAAAKLVFIQQACVAWFMLYVLFDDDDDGIDQDIVPFVPLDVLAQLDKLDPRSGEPSRKKRPLSSDAELPASCSYPSAPLFEIASAN